MKIDSINICLGIYIIINIFLLIFTKIRIISVDFMIGNILLSLIIIYSIMVYIDNKD